MHRKAIRKVISGEVLIKQVIGEKLLYTKLHTYLKPLLSIVTATLRHLSYLGNKFLYACIKKESAACALSHFLTPSIKFSLLLKRCDPKQFFR
jgi:hypothetical protein